MTPADFAAAAGRSRRGRAYCPGAESYYIFVFSTMRTPRKATLLLLAISLVAALPRLYLGAVQFIEYDGYWHVFIAMQEDWSVFWREYQANLHPPLFYLLLKGALAFGRSALIYRAVSIAAGVAAVFLIGKICGKLSRWGPTPALAALAFGLALPGIIISVEVRSYMLSAVFVLASFYYFLDLLDPEPRARSRAAFALFAILAAAAHYSAFFYILTAGLALAWSRFRASAWSAWRRLASDAATFTPVGAVLGLMYVSHAGAYATVSGHLEPFYFRADNGEPLAAFLWRNAQYLFNDFSPIDVGGPAAFGAVCAALAGAAAAVIAMIRAPSPENGRAAAAVQMALGILIALAAAGAAGKYPFGGFLRQQFVLFPFVVITGAILLDRGAAKLGRPAYRRALAAGMAILIVAVSAARFHAFPRVATDIGAAEIAQFRRAFPRPSAVYLDQFDLILFFIHYHDWTWRFLGPDPAVPTMELYAVSRGEDRFVAVRDLTRWNSGLGDATLYLELQRVMGSAGFGSMTTFWVRQPGQPEGIEARPDFAERVAELAGEAGLCLSALDSDAHAVGFAELTMGACPGGHTVCRGCAASSGSIAYSGGWSREPFDQALSGALTYTDVPGATARLTFDGTSVRYVYARAFNRGMAEVLIDGTSMGVLDLYSPETEWQSSTLYEGLSPGAHTIEIRALGRKRPAATGAFIDVDSILAR